MTSVPAVRLRVALAAAVIHLLLAAHANANVAGDYSVSDGDSCDARSTVLNSQMRNEEDDLAANMKFQLLQSEALVKPVHLTTEQIRQKVLQKKIEQKHHANIDEDEDEKKLVHLTVEQIHKRILEKRIEQKKHANKDDDEDEEKPVHLTAKQIRMKVAAKKLETQNHAAKERTELQRLAQEKAAKTKSDAKAEALRRKLKAAKERAAKKQHKDKDEDDEEEKAKKEKKEKDEARQQMLMTAVLKKNVTRPSRNLHWARARHHSAKSRQAKQQMDLRTQLDMRSRRMRQMGVKNQHLSGYRQRLETAKVAERAQSTAYALKAAQDAAAQAALKASAEKMIEQGIPAQVVADAQQMVMSPK